MDESRRGIWYSRAGVLTAFYILVLQQIFQGLYALLQGVGWLRMVRKRLTQHPGFFAPRVALLCPCRGAEPSLEENLTVLTQFDYPDYEIFFAVATQQDPAHAVIRRVAARSKRSVHVVVAGPPRDSSDKVNNLRAALAQVAEDFAVLVFTDSDGRPRHNWLKNLVAPLANSNLGAATTFRWYLPQKGGFWSAMASAWNAAILTMFGEHAQNFCWGGGTAIRRQTFDQIRALEYWSGSASDDYSLTRALWDAGRAIEFVPECLTPAWHDTDLRGLLEFTNRQIIITRVYAPRLWRRAALAHLSYCGTLVYALWVCLEFWLEVGLGLPLLLLTALVPLLAAAKGVVRLLAVTDLLPERRQDVLQYSWAWTLLAPLVPLLYLWNFVVAAFTRRICWRGIRYELVSPSQTRVLPR